MPLANDLLIQARMLATLEPTKPKQASLRRAVSTAYYALFHLLTAACIQRFAPTVPVSLGPRIARALSHAEMKDVCVSVSKGNSGPVLQVLVPASFSVEIRNVAKAFVDLQEARHFADYDLSAFHNRLDSVEFINQAERAFADWNRIRASDEAAVFLSALLFAKRWGR